jgi:hypothetical protein
MSSHKTHKPDFKYHRLPHGSRGCKSKTLDYKGRSYKRSRSEDEYGNADWWFVQDKKQPNKWRRLNPHDHEVRRDYWVILELAEKWGKNIDVRSDSAEPIGPKIKSGHRYSKNGLDKQGRELFQTVKLKDGKRFFFSYNLKKGQRGKTNLHWLRFFIHGLHLRYAFEEETTLRFVKRTLMGLSPELLRKAIDFGKELRDVKSERP